MTAFWRYWLLQVPGWVLLAGLLVAADRWFDLPVMVPVLVLAAWLVKDVLLYRVLKPYYVVRDRRPDEEMVGERAIAQQPIDPRGYVKLGGELWIAELDAGSEPVPSGESVTVASVEGLTLKVRR